MTPSTLSELTIDEFKNLIRNVVRQTILEVFDESDEGLELREDIENRLRHSLETVKTVGETIPAKEVAAKLGLDW